MKKMLAMLLAVLTLCFGAAAMAESVPEADAAAEQAALTDLTAEGQLIQAESFQFYIPADWETVSYTHLDVYKRQVLHHRRRARGENAGKPERLVLGGRGHLLAGWPRAGPDGAQRAHRRERRPASPRRKGSADL